MELQKMAVKFFLEDATNVELREFIPIFHRWIQTRALPNHLLIDVANYDHVHEGPGVLLVCHEANVCIDETEGGRGLLYTRKRPMDGSFEDRFGSILRATLTACHLLEEASELRGCLRFRGNEFRVIANDRLLAPNTEEAASPLESELARSLAGLYPGTDFIMSRLPAGKERLTFIVTCSRDLIHD